MKTEQQKQFLIQAAYYLLIAVLVCVGLKYLLPVVLPLLLGIVIAWVVRKPAVWLARKTHLPEKPVSLLLLAVFYLLLLALLLLAGTQIFSALQEAVPKLPGLYTDRFLPAMNALSDHLQETLAKFGPSIASEVESILQQLTVSLEGAIRSVSSTVMQSIPGFVLGIPGFIINLFAMVVSSFFLMADYKGIRAFWHKHLPEKARNVLAEIRTKLTGSLWIFARAYTILLVVTFLELLAGLLLLRIPYALPIAVAIAVFDLMPILGVGGILIPWVIIAAFLGYYPMAVGIGVLYIVITIVRNTLEPKLVGKPIGLHPLATLASLFIGGKLFGLVGLFGLPVALSVWVQLYRGKTASAQVCQDTGSAGTAPPCTNG